jgi:hypothetical protein
MSVGNPVDFALLLEGAEKLSDLRQETLKVIIEACLKDPEEIDRLKKLLATNPHLLEAILFQIPTAFRKQPKSSVQFIFACFGVACATALLFFQVFNQSRTGYRPASTGGSSTSILDIEMNR